MVAGHQQEAHLLSLSLHKKASPGGASLRPGGLGVGRDPGESPLSCERQSHSQGKAELETGFTTQKTCVFVHKTTPRPAA